MTDGAPAGEEPSRREASGRAGSERRDTNRALDLALRIGEVLLSSGAGAADVSSTMLAVTQACGVRKVSADVTVGDLALRHQPTPGEPAAIQFRRVTPRSIDYDDLTEVDIVVRDLVSGAITLDEARDRVARVVSTGHRRHRWAVTGGWGLMGAGVAVTLGGDAAVAALAFVAACAIDRTQEAMSRRRIPPFFQQVAGGFVATTVAVLATAAHIQVNPSRVVTSGIIMLLAGISFMGATQDAITGFPVTASARLLDAMLATAGIIAGVSAGLSVGRVFGMDLGELTPGATGLAEASAVVAGAALAAAAFAYASYAPRRGVVAVALVAGLGQAVWLTVDEANLGQTWAAAVAAVVIGIVGYSVAGRFHVPPLVIVVPAIVPLLPGLAIYRGLALLTEGHDGVPQLVSALATAVALGAGVIAGQYLAQPLRREARWLETRLAGPRLVGALPRRLRRR